MAVVLSTDERNYFSTSGLRRSHSQPKFNTSTGGFHASSSTSRLDASYHEPIRVYGESPPSSAPSSPRTAPVNSSTFRAPTPSQGKFTFDAGYDDDGDFDGGLNSDQVVFTQFEGAPFFHSAEELEPPPSPKTGHSYSASPNDQDTSTTSTTTSRPESPDLADKAEDDSAVKAQPSRHVDYLSHNWREEDIWESWKYVVSKRGEYSNSARLENASWRTWMKSKNRLKTVSPEALNWLKDCDVTWLYGPLQVGPPTLRPHTPPVNPTSAPSGPDVYNSKKPILKKRSMSEVMLQRSLSASSLVKQAAAAVQAQQKEAARGVLRPGISRAATDYITFPFSSRRQSRDATSTFPSTSSSGIASPGGERKHIHFNEQVEQCIAVDVKGDEDDDYAEPERFGDESDSDDGAIMMKRTVIKKRRPILKRSKSETSTATDSKTIAKLPSTKLKYREDEDFQDGQAQKHSTSVYRSPAISPSSSQETLRPPRPSGRVFLVDDDDEEDDDNEHAFGSGFRSPTRAESQNDLMRRTASSSSLLNEPAGMRRTESGMFMPVEEGQGSVASEGIFGRVVDTVNTARDIAHVIWNVGWRK